MVHQPFNSKGQTKGLGGVERQALVPSSYYDLFWLRLLCPGLTLVFKALEASTQAMQAPVLCLSSPSLLFLLI